MRFSFIHAADLHIDSPLAALGRKNVEARALFADAGRKAVTALMDETLASKAAFLIIAGDIFDGDWADYSTGLFFIRELARLERAGVPVFVVRGNHDAENRMTRGLTWPANVVQFSSRKAESHELAEFQVMLHGRSFGDRNVPDDFVASYPPTRSGWLNIGVLHTALDGVRGHASYAPCTVESLTRFGYDYWALGHIHKPEIVAENPWIVFPGNIQGRSVRETGPRGAMRVDVEDGRIAGVRQIIVDAARWAHETIDISGIDADDDVLAAIGKGLSPVCEAAEGRPLAIRLTLRGEIRLHGSLKAGRDQLAAECQALASRLADTVWIEQLHVSTRAPVDKAVVDAGDEGLDVTSLLRSAGDDQAFAIALTQLADDIRSKLPRELQDDFDALVIGGENGRTSLVEEAQALLEVPGSGDGPE